MLRYVSWLAFKDFVFEARMSFCLVLGLAAVLSPLLILFGLKFGLINATAHRLIENPKNREIVSRGAHQFTLGMVEEIAKRDDVSFAIPNTRVLSARFKWLRNSDTEQMVFGNQMIASGKGDPVFEESGMPPVKDGEIALSAPLAGKLKAAKGTTVEAYIERTVDQEFQGVSLEFEVKSIVPEKTEPNQVAFLPLPVLIDIEDFRDGSEVPERRWTGRPRPETERVFPRIRVFSRSIYDVPTLREYFQNEGIEVSTKASEIESMRELEKGLTLVFWLIAGISVFGFTLSMSANLLANVERKHRDLAVMQQIGVTRGGVVLFPLIQSFLVAVTGTLVALGGFYGVSYALNFLFSKSLLQGAPLCVLLPHHIAAALALTVFVAGMSSAWAGFSASSVEPSEAIRER